MMPDEKLLWGERHLAGSYYSVRVSFGNQLYESINPKLARLKVQSLYWRKGKPSKTGIIKWVLFGVVHENDYRKYLIFKQEAQAQLLINKAANLLNQVKDHKLALMHGKTEELVPEEPVALDR